MVGDTCSAAVEEDVLHEQESPIPSDRMLSMRLDDFCISQMALCLAETTMETRILSAQLAW